MPATKARTFLARIMLNESLVQRSITWNAEFAVWLSDHPRPCLVAAARLLETDCNFLSSAGYASPGLLNAFSKKEFLVPGIWAFEVCRMFTS
jgi:hypothetical protein